MFRIRVKSFSIGSFFSHYLASQRLMTMNNFCNKTIVLDVIRNNYQVKFGWVLLMFVMFTRYPFVYLRDKIAHDR